MDVTKPYEFMRFGDVYGPKPYTCIGFRWAFISQTQVLTMFDAASPTDARLLSLVPHEARGESLSVNRDQIGPKEPKGVPKWLLGPMFFGGLGYQGQKTIHVLE